MRIELGSSRCVFVFEKFVIKIPKFWRISRLGLGIVENLTERYWYCADSGLTTMSIEQYPLAPIYYASSNGLIMVMQRANIVTEEGYAANNPRQQEILNSDLEELMEFAKGMSFKDDVRWGNVGYIDGKLVIVDYGYVRRTMYYDCPAYNRWVDDEKGHRTVRTFWGKFYTFRHWCYDKAKVGLKHAWPWILAGLTGAVAVCTVLLGFVFLGLASIGWESPKVWRWLNSRLNKEKANG